MICRSEDGTLIFCESSFAKRTVGSILVVHGLGEHLGRYQEFTEQMNAFGFDVHRMDLRGHGRSNGVRGHVVDFKDYYKDLDAWIARLESGGELKKDLPCFLFGHSLGALISYLYISQRKAPPVSVKISGLLLSAPAFGLLPGLKTLLESSLSKRVPDFFHSLQLPSGIKSEYLTHDEEIVRLHKSDPLVHNWATPGFYLALTGAIKSLPKTVDRLSVPIFLLLAGKDKVVNTAAAEKFGKRLAMAHPGLVTIKMFHGFYHEIFNETKRERAYRGAQAMDTINSSKEEKHQVKERLLEIIRSRSYREGNFTLASGAKSSFYLDVKETALNPEGAFLIGVLAVSILEENNLWPHAVGGLTLGADPLATAVSLAAFANGRNVAAFLVRKQAKDHGTLAWVEGAKSFPKGAELVVLEDVATTGASALKAVDRLIESGFKPTAVLTVVDRCEGARAMIEQRGLKFFSLCSLPEIQQKNKG